MVPGLRKPRYTCHARDAALTHLERRVVPRIHSQQTVRAHVKKSMFRVAKEKSGATTLESRSKTHRGVECRTVTSESSGGFRRSRRTRTGKEKKERRIGRRNHALVRPTSASINMRSSVRG